MRYAKGRDELGVSNSHLDTSLALSPVSHLFLEPMTTCPPSFNSRAKLFLLPVMRGRFLALWDHTWPHLTFFPRLAGMLVVNVTWRNKTYVGTLLDCTQHDWAPPR